MQFNGTNRAEKTSNRLGQFARDMWTLVRRSFAPMPRTFLPECGTTEPSATDCRPLKRLRLTDGVGRTLFDEFAAHRRSDDGSDETGWVLMGLRERDEAVALATLPAGTLADAGTAHVRFNSLAQVVGSRIVRRQDRRLTILGVVHTHPGSLRHPSDGDRRGDSVWVRSLRGGEGVFAIGTADVRPASKNPFAEQPRENVQVLGELCFSWYSLSSGMRNYRPLPIDVTLGPDLARPLHAVWPTIERHAPALERLYRQQAGLNVQVIDEGDGPVPAVDVPLAEKGDAIRVVLEDEPRYVVRQGRDLFQVDPEAGSIDRGIYLLLAEIAARSR